MSTSFIENDMALKTLLIKQFPDICRTIEKVTATSDLNFLCIYNNKNELFIYLIKTPSACLSFERVEL